MMNDQSVAQEELLFPNADKLHDFIEAQTDPEIRALLRLVHGEFLMAVTAGKLPEGSVDALYFFEILQAAFSRKDAMSQALKGEYGNPDEELEWT
jgi:hypothetical protein